MCQHVADDGMGKGSPWDEVNLFSFQIGTQLMRPDAAG
jgi:hypothetical protein